MIGNFPDLRAEVRRSIEVEEHLDYFLDFTRSPLDDVDPL